MKPSVHVNEACRGGVEVVEDAESRKRFITLLIGLASEGFGTEGIRAKLHKVKRKPATAGEPVISSP